MIRVFTSPGCAQCLTTCRLFENKGILFEKVDVTSDPEAFEFVKSLGYLTLPVVYVHETLHWSGFKPDKINDL